MAKSKGMIYLLIGAVLMLVAGGWYCYNIIEDKNAGQQAAQILEQFDAAQEVIEPSDGKEDAPVIMVEGDAFCGKVIVEKIGIALPIFDQWDYGRLKTAPCRYVGGVATNDMIIAAHNYKSHFGLLNKLQNGDEIKFVDAYGMVHHYEVCQIVTLDGTAVSDMQSGEWDLTLFTCTIGGEQRVTVRCEKKGRQ